MGGKDFLGHIFYWLWLGENRMEERGRILVHWLRDHTGWEKVGKENHRFPVELSLAAAGGAAPALAVSSVAVAAGNLGWVRGGKEQRGWLLLAAAAVTAEQQSHKWGLCVPPCFCAIPTACLCLLHVTPGSLLRLPTSNNFLLVWQIKSDRKKSSVGSAGETAVSRWEGRSRGKGRRGRSVPFGLWSCTPRTSPQSPVSSAAMDWHRQQCISSSQIQESKLGN